MGAKLLTAIALHDPLVTPNKLLRLEFECENSLEMPLVWMTTQVLLYIWKIRCNKKIVDPTLTRATLESKISLLRETRFKTEYTLIKHMVENL